MYDTRFDWVSDIVDLSAEYLQYSHFTFNRVFVSSLKSAAEEPDIDCRLVLKNVTPDITRYKLKCWRWIYCTRLGAHLIHIRPDADPDRDLFLSVSIYNIKRRRILGCQQLTTDVDSWDQV